MEDSEEELVLSKLTPDGRALYENAEPEAKALMLAGMAEGIRVALAEFAAGDVLKIIDVGKLSVLAGRLALKVVTGEPGTANSEGK